MDKDQPTVSRAQLREQLRQVQAFLTSDAYQAFVQEHRAYYDNARDAVFDMVPQTRGDELAREQAIGQCSLLKPLLTWFDDWATATEQVINEMTPVNS